MAEPFAVEFEDTGRTARAIHVHCVGELDAALARLDLGRPRPTLVLIGGAARMTADDLDRLRPLFTEAVAPVVAAVQGRVLDGGTDVGVMRLIGEARGTAAAAFPLVGVVPEGLVDLSGARAATKARLEPHHTHFLIVPGEAWGDESTWFDEVATRLGAELPSVTLLVNGGALARRELERSIAAGRPALVVKGSGGTADELVARSDRRSPFQSVDLFAGPARLHEVLEGHLRI